MAEKLESYEFLGTGKASSKYPWDDWCDGSIWKIVCGEDYTVLPSSMRAQLGVKAKKLGMKVRANQLQRVLVFQFYNEEDE
jgi:hypothetical protein